MLCLGWAPIPAIMDGVPSESAPGGGGIGLARRMYAVRH